MTMRSEAEVVDRYRGVVQSSVSEKELKTRMMKRRVAAKRKRRRRAGLLLRGKKAARSVTVRQLRES